MGFGTGAETEATVVVLTGEDVGYGEGDVNEGEAAEEGKTIEGAVDETSVGFTPFVAAEGASCAILKRSNICTNGQSVTFEGYMGFGVVRQFAISSVSNSSIESWRASIWTA